MAFMLYAFGFVSDRVRRYLSVLTSMLYVTTITTAMGCSTSIDDFAAEDDDDTVETDDDDTVEADDDDTVETDDDDTVEAPQPDFDGSITGQVTTDWAQQEPVLLEELFITLWRIDEFHPPELMYPIDDLTGEAFPFTLPASSYEMPYYTGVPVWVVAYADADRDGSVSDGDIFGFHPDPVVVPAHQVDIEMTPGVPRR